MPNYTTRTLGELLSNTDKAIKRNALSILKLLQKKKDKCNGKHEDVNAIIKCVDCSKTLDDMT